MQDLSAVFELLNKRGDALKAAAVALELGRVEEAAGIVAKAYSTARPEYAPTVRRFADRNSIHLLAG